MTMRRATVTSQGRTEPVALLSEPAFFQARMSVSCTTSSARWRSCGDEAEYVREQGSGVFAVERPHQLLVGDGGE